MNDSRDMRSKGLSVEGLWQYESWSFQAGGTILERFLHKNQQVLDKWRTVKNRASF